MNREELLALRETEVGIVVSGERTFHVRAISAGEMVEFDAAIKSAGSDVQKLLAIQLSTFIGNDAGEKQLSVEDGQEMANRLKARTVQAIVSAGMRLNALTSDEQEAVRGN